MLSSTCEQARGLGVSPFHLSLPAVVRPLWEAVSVIPLEQHIAWWQRDLHDAVHHLIPLLLESMIGEAIAILMGGPLEPGMGLFAPIVGVPSSRSSSRRHT